MSQSRRSAAKRHQFDAATVLTGSSSNVAPAHRAPELLSAPLAELFS
ncbi:hypothetical protein ACNQVK_20715 [Mycobacterium sp. 134]